MTVFEVRFKVGQVTDSYNAFLGLSEEGLAAANTISDAGALADRDLLGFAILEADGDSVDFVYNKASAGGVTTKIDGLKTLAADTFVNLGFCYDPAAPADRRIAVFVDNVEQSTYVTATNIAAATFPDAEELAFLAGLNDNLSPPGPPKRAKSK